jgi:hypothetical protein
MKIKILFRNIAVLIGCVLMLVVFAVLEGALYIRHLGQPKTKESWTL